MDEKDIINPLSSAEDTVSDIPPEPREAGSNGDEMKAYTYGEPPKPDINAQPETLPEPQNGENTQPDTPSESQYSENTQPETPPELQYSENVHLETSPELQHSGNTQWETSQESQYSESAQPETLLEPQYSENVQSETPPEPQYSKDTQWGTSPKSQNSENAQWETSQEPQNSENTQQETPPSGYEYGTNSRQGTPPPPPPGYGYGGESWQEAPQGYGYGPGHQQRYTQKRKNNMALASLILGILSIVMCCCGGFGVILGAVGIVLAILSRGREPMETSAKVGLSLSIGGIVLGIAILVLSFALIGNSQFRSEFFSRGYDDYEDYGHYFEHNGF